MGALLKGNSNEKVKPMSLQCQRRIVWLRIKSASLSFYPDSLRKDKRIVDVIRVLTLELFNFAFTFLSSLTSNCCDPVICLCVFDLQYNKKMTGKFSGTDSIQSQISTKTSHGKKNSTK